MPSLRLILWLPGLLPAAKTPDGAVISPRPPRLNELITCAKKETASTFQQGNADSNSPAIPEITQARSASSCVTADTFKTHRPPLSHS